MRAYAAQLVEQGHGPQKYDAVIVDEAQDLDPSLLWILASLAKAPNRVFLTADADQSIYGSGLPVDRCPRSAEVQRADRRSSSEFPLYSRDRRGRASIHLARARLRTSPQQPEYVHSGPLPAVRRVSTRPEQAIELLARFFRDAARELRLPVWAGALLAPTEKAGERLAAELSAAGIPATIHERAENWISAPRPSKSSRCGLPRGWSSRPSRSRGSRTRTHTSGRRRRRRKGSSERAGAANAVRRHDARDARLALVRSPDNGSPLLRVSTRTLERGPSVMHLATIIRHPW